MTMPRAVLFDLLTALLDSWSVWNASAGSEASGRTWRAEYLRLTYGCGSYVPYEDLVRQAARTTGLAPSVADALEENWQSLPVWSGAQAALDRLAGRTRLAVVTNCSTRLGRMAAARLRTQWDVVITAEEAGFYKPDTPPIVWPWTCWACRPRTQRLSQAPATTSSAPQPSGCAPIGTIAWAWRVPMAHRQPRENPLTR